MHNAIESGPVARRPRLLDLEGAFAESMPLSTHAQPAFAPKPNWNFKRYWLSAWSLLVMTLGLQLGYSHIVYLTATLTLTSETG